MLSQKTCRNLSPHTALMYSITKSIVVLVLDLLVGKEVELVINIPVVDGLVANEDLKDIFQAEDECVLVLWTDSGQHSDTTVRGEGHCTMHGTTHDGRTHMRSMFNVTPKTTLSSNALAPVDARTATTLLCSPTCLFVVAPVCVGGDNVPM